MALNPVTMDEYDLVITNGVCVTAADVAPLDIAIKDEKVVSLAPSGSLRKSRTKRLIDAEGGYVMVRSISMRRMSHTDE